MRTTIDKAGRVVIPAAIRERAGLPRAPNSISPSTSSAFGWNASLQDHGWSRSAGARSHGPPSCGPSTGHRHRRARRGRAEPMAVRHELPRYERATRGHSGFRPQSAPAQSILHAVAEKQIQAPATAWHCCLEFFSVATRLPPEFRLTPAEAAQLLREEVFARLTVVDLPPADRTRLLARAARGRHRRRQNLRRAHCRGGAGRWRHGHRHRQPAPLPRDAPARNPSRNTV